MSDKVNALLERIKPSVKNTQMAQVFKYNEEISKIPGVIKLTLGEPDFNTPEHVKEAGVQAIRDNKSHYTATAGDPKVRQAAAQYLKQKYDQDYDPENELVITAGVTGGMYATLTSIVSEGDEVLIPTPIFPLYFPIVKTNQGKIVYMNTAENNFLLSPEQLENTLQAHPRAKAIILNFPSNPTGMTYTKEQLTALADILRKYDIFVISDEIYSDLIFDQKHYSISHLLPDQTIVLNGLSKSHAMTGWRVGIIAGPAPLVEQIEKIHELSVTSITTVAQYAALEAFQNGLNDSEPMRVEYKKRRDYLHDALVKLGIECSKPQGTFYLMAKIPSDLEQDDFKFSMQLAKEAKVAVIPGSSFGPGGEGYVRFSYAASMDDLTNAIARIEKFLKAKRA
ncbi:aminotransferase class I/II-fold pyridoxal phosphate-dependent enzyme [Pediococcus acidilactici]|uniref:aminotransferase class I/II-fold pyridoxal phosphate-dependent enzyme n=1 Tax=Pediococcus acidilactici TaxID=1254 RepID=UPI000464ECDB|nr:aminotransferase class I/II-fold pyridoxal phosphate-dependent enzyme [Pediococcus acidilactici]KAF0495722.1 aminotransferase class I/II-fold pyridoxal phosphate-dependent enzyme [Pediococcus acidilactici]MCF4061218.1 aminotransferase class I/II-fold pyridoxal phosphate-dependent enzyme [Pediococcus acidilactici]MCJ2192651.1 aminotransferase class I/II-fold pyridoxal phosphate-dependent enzyme [Pediococcus acidilactici]MWB53427.1 aminotransferase class I/II-fold pyridoxal phosphate-dependent